MASEDDVVVAANGAGGAAGRGSGGPGEPGSGAAAGREAAGPGEPGAGGAAGREAGAAAGPGEPGAGAAAGREAAGPGEPGAEIRVPAGACCPACGALLVDDDWFCRACGTVIARHGSGASAGRRRHAAPSEAVAAEDVRVEAASSAQGERALMARRARAVEPYAPEPAPSAFPKVAAMIAALVLAVGLGWWLGGARLPWAVPGGSGSGVGAGSDVGPGTDGEPTSAEPSPGVPPLADARGTWCYTLVEEALSWEDAEAACEEAGGSLAQLRSQSQVDAVLAALEDADVQVVWLGARRDEEAASGFAWLDGAPVDAELFAPGEPNDEDGREDRLALLRVGGVWAVYDVPADLAGEYPAALVGYLREAAE